FSLISLNLNQLVQSLESELEMAAYLSPEADAAELSREIEGWPEVRRTQYLSSEAALQSMLADFPYMGEAAALVNNPLPPTIMLQLLDPAQTTAVSARLRGLPGVALVEDGSDAVETFLAINDALRLGGAILIIILLSSALFSIVNSIRAAISARRNEIEVMRLVGATRGFIRAPFLLEGFLLGLISAAITLALVIPGYQLIVNRLSQNIAFVTFVSDPALLGQIAVLLTALALLVGLVGSAISVAQYLKETS
ncbi:MAG: permease-like cell division protein FtsX, partial [Deinococcota bacterium]|nr:permease-like cell division protein FtsX [Deinococcota bacterium]